MIVKFLHLFKHWTFSINRDLKEYFRPVIFGLQKQYSEMRVAVRVAIVQHSCQIKVRKFSYLENCGIAVPTNTHFFLLYFFFFFGIKTA